MQKWYLLDLGSVQGQGFRAAMVGHEFPVLQQHAACTAPADLQGCLESHPDAQFVFTTAVTSQEMPLSVPAHSHTQLPGICDYCS